MEKRKVILVLDFTEYPGPRYTSQGKKSGEEFYGSVLKDAFLEVLKDDDIEVLVVDLDNTAGYASSFIDEAFGNLAFDYGGDVVSRHLVVISNDEPDWKDVIFGETIPEWDQKKKNGTPRKPVS